MKCVKLNCVFPLKIVVHLTDGIDAPYAEMKRRVEELRLSGKKLLQYKAVNDYLSFNLYKIIAISYLEGIIVPETLVCAKQEWTVSSWSGWSGCHNLTRLCCWNLVADSGTQDPYDSISWTWTMSLWKNWWVLINHAGDFHELYFRPLNHLLFLFLFLRRTILQRGFAAQCHANVLEPEETEEQLDFQGLRYPMSKNLNIFFETLPSIIPQKNVFFLEANTCFFFVFQGSPGGPGSQGHPGDEGGPVCLNAFFLYIYVYRHSLTMFPLEFFIHLLLNVLMYNHVQTCFFLFSRSSVTTLCVLFVFHHFMFLNIASLLYVVRVFYCLYSVMTGRERSSRC